MSKDTFPSTKSNPGIEAQDDVATVRTNISRHIAEICANRHMGEEQHRALGVELTKLERWRAREKAWPNARAAIFRAAEALLHATRALPEDKDLAVLNNWLELALRAMNATDGDLFARMRAFSDACDEDVGLGLVPLARTGSRRGGGSDAALARALAFLVDKVHREGLQAFEQQVLQSQGSKPVASPAKVATRMDVARCLSSYMRSRFGLDAPLVVVAERIYAQMPMEGSRVPDKAGKFRDVPFDEDARATVAAAFRSMGFKAPSQLFAQARMKKSRRKKRRKASS